MAPIVKHQQLCTATTPSKVQVRQIRDHFALNTSSDECIPWLAGVRYAFSRLVVSTPYKLVWCLLRCLIELLLCFQDPNQRHKRNLHTQLAHPQCLNHRIGPIFDLWSRASVYRMVGMKTQDKSETTLHWILLQMNAFLDWQGWDMLFQGWSLDHTNTNTNLHGESMMLNRASPMLRRPWPTP